jgi:hypothetical protein
MEVPSLSIDIEEAQGTRSFKLLDPFSAGISRRFNDHKGDYCYPLSRLPTFYDKNNGRHLTMMLSHWAEIDSEMWCRTHACDLLKQFHMCESFSFELMSRDRLLV